MNMGNATIALVAAVSAFVVGSRVIGTVIMAA